jgi:hypothetical protein
MMPRESDVLLPRKQILWYLRFFGFSGCITLGVGVPVLVLCFKYLHTPNDEQVYCDNPSNRVRFYDVQTPLSSWQDFEIDTYFEIGVDGMWRNSTLTIAPTPLNIATCPTISDAIETWPHTAAWVLGVGVSNICIGCVFATLLFGDAELHRSKCNLVHHAVMVPIGAYTSMILMWAIVGTSIRGNVIWINDLHNLVAVLTFVVSWLTVVIFTVQRNRLTDKCCISLNLIATASLVCIGFGSVSDEAAFALMLGIAELTYISSFSLWCAYLFLQFT